MTERRPRSGDTSARKASSNTTTTTRTGGRVRTASRNASRRVPQRSSAAGARAGRPRRSATTTSRNASATTTGTGAQITPVGFVCPPCGRFIPTEIDGLVVQAQRGSPPRFCSPGCRQAAYRRRQAGVAEDVALQHAGGRNRSLGAPRRGSR